MNQFMIEQNPFEKAISNMRSKTPQFGQNGFFPTRGICGETSGPTDISEKEFNAAREYLLINGRLLRFAINSYELKHIAERAQKTYISNGAIIAAAYSLGFSVRGINGSPNATIKCPRHLSLH